MTAASVNKRRANPLAEVLKLIVELPPLSVRIHRLLDKHPNWSRATIQLEFQRHYVRVSDALLNRVFRQRLLRELESKVAVAADMGKSRPILFDSVLRDGLKKAGKIRKGETSCYSFVFPTFPKSVVVQFRRDWSGELRISSVMWIQLRRRKIVK